MRMKKEKSSEKNARRKSASDFENAKISDVPAEERKREAQKQLYLMRYE
jgi:hypothetical protein